MAWHTGNLPHVNFTPEIVSSKIRSSFDNRRECLSQKDREDIGVSSPFYPVLLKSNLNSSQFEVQA